MKQTFSLGDLYIVANQRAFNNKQRKYRHVKSKINMAGEQKAMLSFDTTINCRNAVQWAADNRLSISTDTSVLVMVVPFLIKRAL